MQTAGRPHAPAREQLEDAMDAFLKHPGVLGVAIVSRDGLPLLHKCPGVANVEVFAAMHAAALGAAELALDHGPRAAVGLVMEAGDRRCLSRPLTHELIGIALVEKGCDWNEAFEGLRGLAG